MTDSSLASGAFADLLAVRGPLNQEQRTKLTVRGVAVVLVVVLHVLMILALLVVETLPGAPRGARPTEVELILAPHAQQNTAPREQTNPNARRSFQEIEPRPITLPPPVIENEKQPVDIMKALGAELACGASHYEYLNPAERKLCHRAPWKLPDNRTIAIAPPPPQPFHLTGAEAAQQRAREAAPCPPGVIVCPDEVIHGKNTP